MYFGFNLVMTHTKATPIQSRKMKSGYNLSKCSAKSVLFGLKSWESASNQEVNFQDPSLHLAGVSLNNTMNPHMLQGPNQLQPSSAGVQDGWALCSVID